MNKQGIGKPKAKFDIRTFTMVGALIVLWVVFSAMTEGSFLTARNISNLTRQMAMVGIMATGMVLVIVSGGIDLSVGSVMGFASCFAAVLQVYNSWSTPQVIILVVLMTSGIGLLQGILIANTGIPAFIVTLGFQLIFKGGILGITEGKTISPFRDDFVSIGQSYLPPLAGYAIATVAFAIILIVTLRGVRSKKQGASMGKTVLKIVFWAVALFGVVAVMNAYQGLPISVVIMLAVVLIFTVIAEKTTFGRRIYAIGGNPEAAKYAGINIKFNTTMVYFLNGLLAGVAGIVLGARLNAGTPSAGQNQELDAIASAVIGGTSMSGGSGKVPGAILGALIMASIDNGMSMMNLAAFWQNIIKGLILIVAVGFDMYYATKKKI
ncbi:MAG: sugar ABC transporter permease [Christensenellaceae bacterium]|jgi:D-xylose transport system permease protein